MVQLKNVRGRVSVLGISIVALCCAWCSTTAAPLTRLRDVLESPRATLSTNPAVAVRAVVTCVDKSYKMVFVQDATAGIFLYDYTPRLALSPGDELDIRGIAARGLFSPILETAEIALIGKTNLPAARPVTIARIVSGSLVAERVEVEGIVQRVRKSGDHMFLTLVAGENRCMITIPISGTNEPADFLDARVRVRGVAAVDFNRQQQFAGFQIFVNDLSDVEVIARPPMDAFQSSLCPMVELPRYPGHRAGEHRVHVRGTVTLHWPGRVTVIQDATGGAVLENVAGADIKVGDEVEAAGFLAPLGTGNRLRNPEVRIVGRAKEPTALPATLADAAANENKLVRLVARVVEWQPARDGEMMAVLSSSNEFFAAVLPTNGIQHIPAAFPLGSVIAAVGVMKLLPSDIRGAPRVALWLRAPSDVLLIHPPPTSPLSWAVVSAVAAAGLALVGAAGLVTLMIRHRRAIAKMSAGQNETEGQFQEMARQLRRSHQDREHIAQELHDNIIQSIYSVGLGIDEARRLAQKNPERVEERLNVAVQGLNGIIRDVRAFLVGLEPKGLEGHELKAALKSVLLTSGEDQQARFSIQIDPSAARNLTSMQATEVFNIAKEAMSNSMQHAHAPLTTVSLVPQGRGVRLEVADDGAGFDPEKVTGESLGLRNLRNRARDIGAQLEIISVPGAGTRIIMDIPLTAHDGH